MYRRRTSYSSCEQPPYRQSSASETAHKMHHNGELRVIFERIETSEEAVQALSQMQAQAEHLQAGSQAMVGNLEGLEIARSAHMKLDEEGGRARPTARPGIFRPGSRLLAAAASHPDAERGTTDAAVIQGCGLPPGVPAFV